MTKKRSFSSFQRAESTAERFCRFLINEKGRAAFEPPPKGRTFSGVNGLRFLRLH